MTTSQEIATTMSDAVWGPNLIDSLQQPIWTARDDGTIVRANAFWYSCTPSPAPGASVCWWDHAVHPDDISATTAAWHAGVATEAPFEIEFRLHCEDGTWRWNLARAAPLADGHDDGATWSVIAVDINERYRTRESLRASEARLNELVASADDLIYTLGLDGLLVDINPAAERVLGYAPEKLIGTHFERIVMPDQVPYTRGMLDRKLAGEPGSVYELDVRASDGRIITLEVNTRLVYQGDEPVAINGVARDITNRRQRIRQAELSAAVGGALTTQRTLDAQLQEAMQALVDHLDAAFARVWLIDKQDADLLVLRASAGQYTHLDGDHSRMHVGQYKIGAIAASRAPFLTNDVLHEPAIRDQEWARREGMVAFAGYPILAGDRLLGVIGVFARHALDGTTQSMLRSITDALAVAIEREEAERARDTVLLREQEARVWAEVAETRYRNLFDGVADAILVTNAQQRILDANIAALDLLGYSREALMQLEADEIIADGFDWGDAQREMLHAAGHWQGELELRKRDGRLIPVEVRTTVVHLPSGPVYLSAGRDISERKHLERLQRDFLAMVTHDVRTPLTSIKGWLQLLDRRSELDDRDRRFVTRSLEQSEKITALINDLADLVTIEAGRLQMHPAQDDLVAIVEEHVEQVQDQTDTHELRLRTDADAMPGAWDRRRLGQVLQNLLTNAVKYSPDGGVVDVDVRKEGDMVNVVVRDSGIGISDEHLPLLFERFYREDVTGAGGLGLGLHITRLLVEAHGGEIHVKSRLGAGSAFTVALPIRDASG